MGRCCLLGGDGGHGYGCDGDAGGMRMWGMIYVIYVIYAKVVSGYWRQLSAEDEPKWEVTDESR